MSIPISQIYPSPHPQKQIWRHTVESLECPAKEIEVDFFYFRFFSFPIWFLIVYCVFFFNKTKYLENLWIACVHVQLCLTFCGPVDCSPPGSSFHGISKARILEWVAISSSRESSRPRDQTWVSYGSRIGRRILYHWATWEALWITRRWLKQCFRHIYLAPDAFLCVLAFDFGHTVQYAAS